MTNDKNLNLIREQVFQGLSTYSKKFPEFVLPPLTPFKGKEIKNKFWSNIKKTLANTDEILLYIHFPFCQIQCAYCNTFPFKLNEKIQNRYLNCLLKEISIVKNQGILNNKKVKAIYLGGGTPTDFKLNQIKKVLDSIKINFHLDTNCNITCESNPINFIGLKGKELINKLIGIGINRFSIGIQTFDQEILNISKRNHTTNQAIEAIQNLKEYKIPFNVDMMVGLPGQSIESVKKDLQILTKLKPTAIEYMKHEIVNPQVKKIYKENSQYLVNDDSLFKMVLLTQRWMRDHNYEQNGYLSNKSDSFPYRYYWNKEVPYWAFGSTASSHLGKMCFYTLLNRYDKLRIYFSYIENGLLPFRGFKIFTIKERMYRALYMNIQTKEGLNIRNFISRFGKDPKIVFKKLLDKLISLGLIEQKQGSIKYTKIGSFFNEDITCLIRKYAIEDISNEKKIKINKEKHNSIYKTLFVSVIIPTFNRKEILHHSIQALLNQDYPKDNYEIIIVDDGSNDGTKDTVEKYIQKNKNIKYIFQENKGFRVSKARNLGGDNAKGEILIFLNDDIIALSNLISNHVKALSNKSDVVLGYTSGYFTESGYDVNDLSNIKKIKKDFRDHIFSNPKLNNSIFNKNIWSYFVATNFSIRKQIFNKNKFNESFVGWGGEDEDFGYRLVGSGYRIIMDKKCIGLHIDHNKDKKIKEYTENKVIALVNNLIKLYKMYPNNEVKEYIKRRYDNLPAQFKDNEKITLSFNSIIKIKN